MAAAELAPADDAPIVRAPAALALATIALLGCAASSTAVALAFASDHLEAPATRSALMVWVVLPYVLAGAIAWWRRPESRFGALMVAAGFTMFLSSLTWANAPVPYTVGVAFDLIPAVVFVHVFLAFPTGRLDRLGRVLVIAGYAVAIGLQLVGMALDGFGSDNLLAVFSEPQLAYDLLRLQLAVLSLLALAGIGVLVARRHGGGRPLRRSLAWLIDSFALVLVMVAFLFLSGALGGIGGEPAFERTRRVVFLGIGVAPVVFLVGLLHARLARTAVADLVLELRADPAPARLRDALARALRDPSLSLVYWLAEYDSYADVDGQPVELPASGARQAVTFIDHDGERIAALVHDPALRDEPELLDTATAAAALALDNGRLHAELQARLQELQGSRARIVEATHRERQRLERNLHDGAQQRLVALSLELGLLQRQLGERPDTSERLERARTEIAASLAELREIARGIHPAVVTGHGLAVALEQLCALAPVPVTLDVAVQDRLPEAVEVAAYYVVSECLANIGKYAAASAASVAVAQADGVLVLEVVDDGVGGADPERGSGLRGLADRVEALGGALALWSPAGGGTRLRAEIPCAP